MLIPLWFDIKRLFGVPFIVYMDDVIFCCKTREEYSDLYTHLNSHLKCYFDLSLNVKKTQAGRFASDAVTFCGWKFSAGYVRISEPKIEAFKERLNEVIKHSKNVDSRTFIKRINRKIDGFGNYYKHGDVAKQFEALDVYIRKLVRSRLKTLLNGKTKNANLDSLGLHSLDTSYRKLQMRKSRTKTVLSQPTPPKTVGKSLINGNSDLERFLFVQVELLEKMNDKMTQMLSLQKTQLRVMQEMNSVLR